MDTAASAFLSALREAGVTHVFANFGSDHPGIVEAIAKARAEGEPIPEIVTAPHEMVALSAAHGFALASGRPAAVLVHVDCGTQSLAGAVHNVARGRIPVLIFAGLSPATQEGEAKGSRNEFIHWLQDAPDQRGILRNYVKYEHEIRHPGNLRQLVWRALQHAESDPKGPVYLVAAREVLEAPSPEVAWRPERFAPVRETALPAGAARDIAAALEGAHRPLVVTSYLGRNPAAVAELVRLAARLGVGVLESAPSHMNFPARDPHWQGNHWNQPFQEPALAEADLVLVIDSDIPWVPATNRPSSGARIVHIDVDPLKPTMPLWYFGAHETFRADSASALAEINACLDRIAIDAERARSRRDHYARRHALLEADLAARERAEGDVITPEILTAAVRNAIDDEALVLNEGITSYHVIAGHLQRTRPRSLFASGGSSLGWAGGAAIGAKLADPGRLVVSLTGDGSYLFSIPSTVHWMARRYRAPFLQVVYNNRGWKAPKSSALAVHPDGHASRTPDLGLHFDPPPDYAGIAAAAGGAFARKVECAGDLDAAIAEALVAVREEKRAAVLDVWLPRG